jgi:hypothetical protein
MTGRDNSNIAFTARRWACECVHELRFEVLSPSFPWPCNLEVIVTGVMNGIGGPFYHADNGVKLPLAGDSQGQLDGESESAQAR